MFDPRVAGVRPLRPRAFAGLACLALTTALIFPYTARGQALAPAGGSGEVPVLVGFKTPSFSIAAATRASILSRTRERARIAALRGHVSRQFTRADAVAATLPPEAIAALARDPSVAYVEEDRPVHMLQALPSDPGHSPLPLVPELVPWGIGSDDQIAGVRATESGADGDGVSVGVLDTGIGPHPEIEVAGGYNFVANSNDFSDDVGHGTHVAGTIAAARNGAGVVGVAPKVRLYALKVLDSRGAGRTSTIVTALDWAAGHHLQVINMSFGSDRGSQTEQRAVEAAAKAGVVMVAAAGNNGGAIGFPAAYPQVIAVGAVDQTGKVASFSSRGNALGFVAPGVDILSTVPETRGYWLPLVARDGSSADLAVNRIRNAAATPPAGITGPVRFAGRGTKSDVAAVDLKGAIALIERGDILFDEKVANAAAAGAIGALIFNNEPGTFRATLSSAGAIPALSLSRETGLALKESSSGPLHLYLSPNALYTRFSGTSMASPHVAGVAALVLSVRSDLDPERVRAILRESARDLGPSGRDDAYGDGLVNAAAAVRAARGLPASPSP